MNGWSTTDRVTGRDTQLAKLSMKVPPLIRIAVGARSTSGTVKRVKTGSADVSRTAGENVITLRAQAKAGRTVAFLTPQETKSAADLWRTGFRAAWNSPQSAHGAIMREAAVLGAKLVKWFAEHIERGIGKDGMPAVSAATAKRKAREVGPGLPPLVRTGQLLRSFIFHVKGG